MHHVRQYLPLQILITRETVCRSGRAYICWSLSHWLTTHPGGYQILGWAKTLLRGVDSNQRRVSLADGNDSYADLRIGWRCPTEMRGVEEGIQWPVLPMGRCNRDEHGVNLNLTHGNLSMQQYSCKFVELSRYIYIYMLQILYRMKRLDGEIPIWYPVPWD